MTEKRQSRTDTAIYQKGFLAPFLAAQERPFIKMLNWFTGFGKTYTAAVFALDLVMKYDVIPVFIAPLQSLVAGFSDDVRNHNRTRQYGDEIERAIQERGAHVPVHRLYSIEYHLNDRTFFSACMTLVAWLQSSPTVRLELAKFVEADAELSLESRLTELRVKSTLCQDSPFLAMSVTDEAYEETKAAYLRSARRARTLADALTVGLIKLELSSRALGRREGLHLGAPEAAEMVRRLHPLQAFLDAPGVIVCTASKAQVGQKVYIYDDTKKKCRPLDFDTLPDFLAELNKEGSDLGRRVSRRTDSARVVTFVDEEEDSYWYLFDQRKSVVNPAGRNDLNVVITEFFTYFDLKWPLAFEKAEGNRGLAARVYDHLEHFAEVAASVDREFELERIRTNAKFISDERRVCIFRELLKVRKDFPNDRFTNAELLEVLQQLHDKNDVHSGYKRFRQKAGVLKQLRDYVTNLKWDDHTRYESFRQLRDLVYDKKFFTMSRATYGEVLDQPTQTFFTESASVMDTEFLKRVQLERDTGHQTIRLQYHEDDAPRHAFTLLHYLEFVLFMARILARQSGDGVVEFSKPDIERYPNLHKFRQDARSLFKGAIAEEGISMETSSDEILTDGFFYSETKSLVTLEESPRQAEEYNKPADVSLTLSITSLRATPEEDISTALGRNNGVYLMSATGGLENASSGAFNVRRLKEVVAKKEGLFFGMAEDEIEIVSRHAMDALKKRERHVVILDDSNPASHFDVSPNYEGLLQRFHGAIPERGDEGYTPLNRHKQNEIAGLVASLDRLLSSSLRTGLVLCQTVSNMRTCLMTLARDGHGWVRQNDKTGHHFTVRTRKLPTYVSAGAADEVTIILYNASSFRKRESSQTGMAIEKDDLGQFSEELERALEVGVAKLLLWTAYASASRGINFIARKSGVKHDFELFCLLNDPYYTEHTRPSGRGFSMQMFQSFAQIVRDEEETWPLLSRGDFLYEYSRSRWKRLQREHVVDITRTIFQALGRGERCPGAEMSGQYIYLSSEAIRSVHLGLGHASELRRRASPAQRSVLAAVDRHNQETAIFSTPEQRRLASADSLKKAIAFREFTADMPRRFRSDQDARTMWSALFDASMFRDPDKYLAKLKRCGVPQAYRDGCYFEAPMTAQPYTRVVSIAGRTESVVTDAMDATDIYDWTGVLAPDGLQANLSKETRGLLRTRGGFVVDRAGKGGRLFPQPWFVTEIMKGYLAELEFEAYVKDQFNIAVGQATAEDTPIRYLDIDAHDRQAQLYQLFDYFLLAPNNTLVAVDMKNWARSTDRLKRQDLQEEATDKHARLRALFPDMTVHAIYLNLYGAHKYTVARQPGGGAIRFMSLFVQNTTAGRGWTTNQNLATVLLGH